MRELDTLPTVNKRWTTRLAVLAGFMVSGCGASSLPPRHQTPPAPAIAPQPAQADPLLQSLNNFRQGVKHHKAKILMGACVGWPDEDQGLAITLNPGIASYRTSKTKHNYYVFTATDTAYNPPLQQMNGPDVNNPEVAVKITPSQAARGSFRRELTATINHDPNHQLYYEDSHTGQPVMDTVLVDGPPTLLYLGKVCSALSQHQPIPPNNTKF